MEKQPHHQEYRDTLADKLTEIRNSDTENPEIAKAKAQGYLDAKKEDPVYHDSAKEHKKEINKKEIQKKHLIEIIAPEKEERFSKIKEVFPDAEFLKIGSFAKTGINDDNVWEHIESIGVKNSTIIKDRGFEFDGNSSEDMTVVVVSHKDLGIEVGGGNHFHLFGSISMKELLEKTEKVGLQKCPKDTALKLTLGQIPDLVKDTFYCLWVVSDPVLVDRTDVRQPHYGHLGIDKKGLWLRPYDLTIGTSDGHIEELSEDKTRFRESNEEKWKDIYIQFSIHRGTEEKVGLVFLIPNM